MTMKPTYAQQDLFIGTPVKEYFNTTKLAGSELQEEERNASWQNTQILKLYQEFRIMSPSECWKLYKLRYNSKVPLTSIRRAITTLTKRRKLLKTTVKRKGEFGKLEYVWKINETE